MTHRASNVKGDLDCNGRNRRLRICVAAAMALTAFAVHAGEDSPAFKLTTGVYKLSGGGVPAGIINPYQAAIVADSTKTIGLICS